MPDGAKMAERTLNPRLGILGGISILGTTGIVIPYSCSSWIHSIHRGVDVARAMGFTHVSGATGNASEAAAQKLHGLHEVQLIDMGDFVGGMLKYIRDHPVPRVTIAGGVAKMTKLAQGLLDVHSKRGMADLDALAAVAIEAGASPDLATRIRGANTVAEAFAAATAEGVPVGDAIARQAWTHRRRRAQGHRHRARSARLQPRRRVDGTCAVCSPLIARPARETAADNRRRRASSRENPPPPAPRPTKMIAVRSIGSAASFASMSSSVPRMIRSSGHDARNTTATGQSAP